MPGHAHDPLRQKFRQVGSDHSFLPGSVYDSLQVDTVAMNNVTEATVYRLTERIYRRSLPKGSE